MQSTQFLNQYIQDSFIQTLAAQIKAKPKTQLKGVIGSLDAVLASALHQINPQLMLFVQADREAAAYFQNDLQNLNPSREVHLFPASYKKPYQLDETENANVLMRAEILNIISNTPSLGHLIVTYPDAVAE